MSGYLGTLKPTGVPVIDNILFAIEKAGDRYHHTDQWNDAEEGEESCVEQIQAACNAAAEFVKKQEPPHAAP